LAALYTAVTLTLNQRPQRRWRALKDRGGLVIARLITTLIGILLIVYGVIAAISPLPLGVPLIILGLLMIALAIPAARPLIRRMRRKWRWFDKLVETLGERSPEDIKELIEETDPEHQDEDEDKDKDDQGEEEKASGQERKVSP